MCHTETSDRINSSGFKIGFYHLIKEFQLRGSCGGN